MEAATRRVLADIVVSEDARSPSTGRSFSSATTLKVTIKGRDKPMVAYGFARAPRVRPRPEGRARCPRRRACGRAERGRNRAEAFAAAPVDGRNRSRPGAAGPRRPRPKPRRPDEPRPERRPALAFAASLAYGPAAFTPSYESSMTQPRPPRRLLRYPARRCGPDAATVSWPIWPSSSATRCRPISGSPSTTSRSPPSAGWSTALAETMPRPDGPVWVLGAWYGVLGAMLLDESGWSRRDRQPRYRPRLRARRRDG